MWSGNIEGEGEIIASGEAKLPIPSPRAMTRNAMTQKTKVDDRGDRSFGIIRRRCGRRSPAR